MPRWSGWYFCKLGSLYEHLSRAKLGMARLEFHYTPTHGILANMAEIELSFSRGCLTAVSAMRRNCGERLRRSNASATQQNQP